MNGRVPKCSQKQFASLATTATGTSTSKNTGQCIANGKLKGGDMAICQSPLSGKSVCVCVCVFYSGFIRILVVYSVVIPPFLPPALRLSSSNVSVRSNTLLLFLF